MEIIQDFIGADKGAILWWQMILRATVIFFLALLMVRLAGKRIFGKHTAFDIVLGIVLGSILGRAITGDAPFLLTLLAAITLVFLHWLVAWVALKWDFVGTLVKGNYQALVKDGEIQWDKMKSNKITEKDLLEAIRLHGGGAPIEDIRSAYYERSGDISIQLRDR